MQTILKEKQKSVGKGESLCTGVSVQCDRTECVFEFALYKYAGRPQINTDAVSPPPVMGPNGECPPMGKGPPRPPPQANAGPPMGRNPKQNNTEIVSTV